MRGFPLQDEGPGMKQMFHDLAIEQEERRAHERADEARDAARWRALMASPRMHFMGSAGFVYASPPDEPECRLMQKLTPTCPPDAHLHFGIEFWSDFPPHPEHPDVFERKLMEAYADEMVRRQKAPR